MKALLVGYGDIASRLSPLLLSAGWSLSGLRRSPGSVPGVTLHQGDCRDPAVLAPLLEAVDAVVMTLTPAAMDEQGYRDSYVAAAAAMADAVARVRQRPRHLFWVSSTSVYGEHNGEWVDESTKPHPRGYAGRCLLEAESQLAATGVPLTVVRFSGIYGPGGNRVIERVREGRCAPPEPVQWSNRIHRDDCAGVLCHLLERLHRGQSLEREYLASDCEPVPLHEVHQWIAGRLGIPVEQADARSHRGNRRCSNQRLLDSGYRFIYPSFREGYGSLL